MNYIYLGSPYTDPDEEVIRKRVEQVEDAVAALVCAGFCVYSPVAHFHHIAARHSLPKPFDFWKGYNYSMLRGSGGVLVLSLHGVGHSVGVTAEVAMALRLHMDVVFSDLDKVIPLARQFFSHCRFHERYHHASRTPPTPNPVV